MRRKRSLCRIILLIFVVLFQFVFLSLVVTAIDDVYISQPQSSINVGAGEKNVSFSLQLTNSGQSLYSGITVEIGSAGGFENSNYIQGPDRLGPRETNTYFFSVDITKDVNSGIITLPVTFYYDSDPKKVLSAGGALFNVSGSSSSGSGAPVLEMSYRLSDPQGFMAGEMTVLTIALANRGDALIQDVRVSLSLTDKMSMNNSSAYQYVGNLGLAEEKTVSFPILAEKDIENKNYPIAVNISGFSSTGVKSDEQTIFVPVYGAVEEDTSPIGFDIADITLPEQIIAGGEFTLVFRIYNTGKRDAEAFKVTVTPDQGVVNKTKNIFAETRLTAGEVRDYFVTFITTKAQAQKSCMIHINATAGKEEEEVSVSQYAGIYLDKPPEKQTIKTVKTPQLIVSDYDFGESMIKAGSEFPLSISFFNTSSKKIYNAKISIKSDSGTFIPVGMSSSFYIDRIEAGKIIVHNLRLSADPNAEQRTTAITIDMTYEDADGGQYTASDIISVPVVQETKLTVDDITGPPELYAGDQSGLDVRFYNTGKSVIRNLRVNAEGDFDLMDSAAYYAGNMNSGTSDSCSFAFIPRAPGTMNGVVRFTYEDPSGDLQTLEKDFSLQVMEMPFYDPDDMTETPPEASGNTYRIYIIVGALILLLILLAIIIYRIIKRRRMHRELAIDDQYEHRPDPRFNGLAPQQAGSDVIAGDMPQKRQTAADQGISKRNTPDAGPSYLKLQKQQTADSDSSQQKSDDASGASALQNPADADASHKQVSGNGSDISTQNTHYSAALSEHQVRIKIEESDWKKREINKRRRRRFRILNNFLVGTGIATIFGLIAAYIAQIFMKP